MFDEYQRCSSLNKHIVETDCRVPLQETQWCPSKLTDWWGLQETFAGFQKSVRVLPTADIEAHYVCVNLARQLTRPTPSSW